MGMILLFSPLMIINNDMIQKTAQSVLDTEFGSFEILIFQDEKMVEHVVLKREWKEGDVPLVRIHSKCATGDIFASVFCDCRGQLHEAMKRIQTEGGLLIYLEQEGRGLGLTHKIKAYELQRQGMDTVEADEKMGEGVDVRSYEMVGEILKDGGLQQFVLLTNNPSKMAAMVELGFQVERRVLSVPSKSERGEKYLQVKKTKMKHDL